MLKSCPFSNDLCKIVDARWHHSHYLFPPLVLNVSCWLCLSFSLHLRLSLYLSTTGCLCLSLFPIYFCLWLSVCLSVCRSVCLSIGPSRSVGRSVSLLFYSSYYFSFFKQTYTILFHQIFQFIWHPFSLPYLLASFIAVYYYDSISHPSQAADAHCPMLIYFHLGLSWALWS